MCGGSPFSGFKKISIDQEPSDLLHEALDSLEYVEKNFPGLHGYGVRQERITKIQNYFKKPQSN